MILKIFIITFLFVSCGQLPSKYHAFFENKIQKNRQADEFIFCASECQKPTIKTLFSKNALKVELVTLKNNDQLIATALFAFNEVMPKKNEALKYLRNRILSASQRIKVIGFTDNSGSKQANKIVALGRANSIAKLLLSSGVNSNQVEVISKPHCCYLNNNENRKEMGKNRRVEIYLTREKS